MNKRECGECKACCEGWLIGTVLEQDLRPGNPCRHCNSTGCSIYETRPEDPCRIFECGWLQEDSPLDDDMRPDQSGVIVKWKRNWGEWLVSYAMPVGESIPPETLERLKALANEHGIPMIIGENLYTKGTYSGRRLMGYGPPDFVNAVRQNIHLEDVFKPSAKPLPGLSSPTDR